MTFKSMILLPVTAVICIATTCEAWTGLPARTFSTRATVNTVLASSLISDDVEDPCWQDIWNYDCAMSNVYSAAFVANDWLNSMPCAAGLVDCDTPEELKLPGPVEGSGVESVDVMSYLNLKRAKPLTKPLKP